jgi:glutathione S-transferase
MAAADGVHVLHDSRLSGNAWKVRLLLSHLGLPFRRVTYVLPEGKTRTPEFLAWNPLGKVPVLELPTGEALFESCAILCHLSEGTPFLPPPGIDRAHVMQWLFFEQAEAVKPLAAPRFWIAVARRPEEKAAEIAEWHAAGNKVLGILDARLAAREFLATDRCTIADIANFPYVAMSPEGGFDLGRYPNVLAWVERVRRQPGHVPLIEEPAAAKESV